jgi:hypothetical protein
MKTSCGDLRGEAVSFLIYTLGNRVQPQFLLVLGVSSCMLVDPSTGRLSSSFLFIERLIRVFRLGIND